MSNIVKRHDQFMQDFFPFSIGLDGVFSRLGSIKRDNLCNTFPPYNIIKDGDKILVEMALAGYSKDNIEVVVEDGILSITGDNKDRNKPDNHIHQGIATRNFVRKFTLGEQVEVNSAEMKDGMLVVELEEIVPPEKQPKRITIN